MAKGNLSLGFLKSSIHARPMGIEDVNRVLMMEDIVKGEDAIFCTHHN